MPTFRQQWTYYEDGHGSVRILAVLSDTFDGLFETLDTKQTNILDVESSKKDLQIKEGTLAQDEIKINVDASAVETEDDEDALAFFLDAQDPVTPRYAAVFLDTPELPSAPNITDCEFIGRIDPKLKGTDLRHYGVIWSTALNPLREWSTTASTFMDVTLDKILLKDLIYGNVAENVTGIDTTWESANVSDRLSYFKSPGGDLYYNREARFEKLVNLSALLRKLADNVEQTLFDQGIGAYTIVIDDIDVDFASTPARFDVEPAFIPPWKTRTLLLTVEGKSTYAIKADDAVVCSLGDTFVASDEAFFIHYRMVKPTNDREKRLSFDRIETFPELLYALASTLGLFVRFRHSDATTIHIEWLSRQSIDTATQVYIKDATDGTLDLAATKTTEGPDRQNGLTTTYTVDGFDEYWDDKGVPRGESELYKNQNGKGVQPLFTTGVVLAKLGPSFMEWGLRVYGEGQYKGRLPQNTVFYRDGSRESIYPGSLGLTSMLYVRVVQNGEYINGTSEKIFAPIARVSATIDSTARHFESLSDYINALNALDEGYFTAEYDLTIPGLNCFSVNSDGSASTWKALQLGRRVTIEENGTPRDFTIVGIERNYQTLETKLKLHRSSRFAFSPSSGLTSAVDIEIETPIAPGVNGLVGKGSVSNVYILSEDANDGDAVAIDTYEGDGIVYVRRATATDADAGSVFGLTTQSGVAGDLVEVQSTGRYVNASYDLTPNVPLYVRTAAYPTRNVSQSLLTGASGTENAVIEIGLVDTPTSVIIDLTHQFTFEKGASWACGCV